MTLFPIDPAPEPVPPAVGSAAKGHRAVALLIARLLELGHKVAVPVVDDDGVDLIVNYRITVQVKATAFQHSKGGWQVSNNRADGPVARPHVDVLALYVIPIEMWWHLPRGTIGNANSVTVWTTSHRGRSQWRDAWHVYNAGGAAPPCSA